MLVVLDTELGGLDYEHSLLTAYLGIVNGGVLYDELDLKLKPNNGNYLVTGIALEVNKINLTEHDKEATTYKEAGTVLYKFLNRNSSEGANKLIVLGHNVATDVRQLWKVVKRPTRDKFCSYRFLDTSIIAQFLTFQNKLPNLGSLAHLAEYFKIDHQAHTAKGDALATLAVFKKLSEIR